MKCLVQIIFSCCSRNKETDGEKNMRKDKMLTLGQIKLIN